MDKHIRIVESVDRVKEFIEWSVKPIGQLCCRWDVSDSFTLTF